MKIANRPQCVTHIYRFRITKNKLLDGYAFRFTTIEQSQKQKKMKWIMKNWKYLALIGLSLCLASLLLNTSCVSQRTVRDLVAQHTLELHQVNTQLDKATTELLYQTDILNRQTYVLNKQTFMLDSLMPLVGLVDTIFSHTETIVDHTDSIIRMNHQILRQLHRIEWNTDTILNILRTPTTLFDDKF